MLYRSSSSGQDANTAIRPAEEAGRGGNLSPIAGCHRFQAAVVAPRTPDGTLPPREGSESRPLQSKTKLVGGISAWAGSPPNFLPSRTDTTNPGHAQNQEQCGPGKLITELNEILWQMWEHHNNVLHKTMTPQKEQQLENIREQIGEQFILGKIGLPKRDQHYVNPKKKTWALQLGLEDATRWLSSVAHSREGRLAMQNCAAAGLLMQQRFMRNWQHGVPNTPVRPITIRTRGTANPVDTISVSDNTSVSDLESTAMRIMMGPTVKHYLVWRLICLTTRSAKRATPAKATILMKRNKP